VTHLGPAAGDDFFPRTENENVALLHPSERGMQSLLFTCCVVFLIGIPRDKTDDKKEQPHVFVVQFVDRKTVTYQPRYTFVLTLNGDIRDTKTHELEDSRIKEILSLNYAKDMTKPHIIRLYLNNAKQTDVKTLTEAIKRLRSLADPRLETRVIIFDDD
jgi:hypothetical protein